MNILFLDDDDIRIKIFTRYFPDATVVKTAASCILQIQLHPWDLVCLDHDLEGEDTGMEVVRWILRDSNKHEGTNRDIGWFIIHSHNYYAVPNMVKDLKKAYYRAVELPFGNVFIQTVSHLVTDHPNAE